LPSDPVVQSEQAEQEVLGAEVVVPERPRLVRGKDNDDQPCGLREALEHRAPA
jgi:hypothetical protein